jgi:hypothetical protein
MYAGTGFNVQGTTLRVEVRANGHALPLWQRPGDGQLFVAGRGGQEFIIQVENNSYGNLLVVPAIDHRSVLEDKPADVNGMGQIIPAHTHYVFSGWRQDENTTRPFVFTFPERSVALQAEGRNAVTGVIGLAVYSEDVPYPVQRDYFGGDDAERGEFTVSAATASVGRDLGTGIGSREQYSPVRPGSFRRGGMSLARLLYASEESLHAAGLMGPPEPSAFPEHKAFQDYESA